VPVFMGGLHGQKIGPRLAEIRSVFGIRSVLRVPIGLDARAQRMLALCWTDDVERPAARVRALVQRYGDQVDVALSQARRREAQEEAERLHRRFERSLLPKLPLSHPKLDKRLHYRPRESRLELGGDFIDIVDCGESGLAVIGGDVSGHGPDAAALGATLRSGWEAGGRAEADPGAGGTALRNVAERERATLETFATAFLTWIDPGNNRISVLNLGHPPPLLCSNGAVSALAAPPQPPIGGFIGDLEPPLDVRLPKDWCLLFYTDGLIEGRISPNQSERFGFERLIDAVAALPKPIDAAGLGRLVADVRAAGCEPFKDDVTVVSISRTE